MAFRLVASKILKVKDEVKKSLHWSRVKTDESDSILPVIIG